jgi:hypothetical protein
MPKQVSKWDMHAAWAYLMLCRFVAEWAALKASQRSCTVPMHSPYAREAVSLGQHSLSATQLCVQR